MGNRRAALAAALLLSASPALAVPPLVSGDVPTADKGHAEVYLGFQQEEAGGIEREVPADEVVLGVSPWQEVTFELPYQALTPQQGEPQRGGGDAVLGTKVMFLREGATRPGAALSFDTKFANADVNRGLGSGAVDYDLRLRAQKTLGRFTPIVNVGHTFVGAPVIDGLRQDRRDVWFLSFVQEYRAAEKTNLLAEAYWNNSDTPGEPSRFAGNIGFARVLLPWLQFQSAVGRSLRGGNFGGPRLRMYAGIKVEFPVFTGSGG